MDHDEDEAWVNEQIRKGVGRRAEPSPALAAAQQRNKAGGSRGSSQEAQPPAAPAAGPGAWASLSARQAEGVATAGDGVIKALQNGVAQLQVARLPSCVVRCALPTTVWCAAARALALRHAGTSSQRLRLLWVLRWHVLQAPASAPVPCSYGLTTSTI